MSITLSNEFQANFPLSLGSIDLLLDPRVREDDDGGVIVIMEAFLSFSRVNG